MRLIPTCALFFSPVPQPAQPGSHLGRSTARLPLRATRPISASHSVLRPSATAGFLWPVPTYAGSRLRLFPLTRIPTYARSRLGQFPLTAYSHLQRIPTYADSRLRQFPLTADSRLGVFPLALVPPAANSDLRPPQVKLPFEPLRRKARSTPSAIPSAIAEGDADEAWDQFAENERLYGVRTDFDEEMCACVVFVLATCSCACVCPLHHSSVCECVFATCSCVCVSATSFVSACGFATSFIDHPQVHDKARHVQTLRRAARTRRYGL